MKKKVKLGVESLIRKTTPKRIDEGFIDVMTQISGIIGIAVGVKLFGKFIFPKILEKVIGSIIGVHDKVVFKKAIELMVDEPETIYIKYKKFKDYYQLSIDLKHYGYDTIFDKNKNPLTQITSEDFPIKIRVYNNDFVDIKGGTGSTKKVNVEGIYGLIESYINDMISEEDKTLRDQDEYSDIVDIFVKHIKTRDADIFLDELKSEKIKPIIDKIYELTLIDEDIIRKALDNVIGGYRSVDGNYISSIIESFYTNLIHLNNKTIKEYVNKNKIMKKRIIKLTESDLEKLVRKVIKEEEGEKKEKTSTLTKHPAYPAIDRLERELENLKMEFKDSIANAVSGEDGYHSEIDKFSEDFGKFITKVSNLKSKINDYQIANKDKEMAEARKRKEKQRQYQHHMREKARKNGRNYSY